MAQPIWITPAGTIGTYPSQVPFTATLIANAVLPASSINYTLLSGSLPPGVTLTSNDGIGLLSGSPGLVTNSTTYTFAIRATDNLGNIRDRTFSLTTSGAALPQFTTPTGTILSTYDSTWVSLPIQYTNPIATNEVIIRVIQGQLPPGLEINNNGLIRGYAEPPISSVNLPLVVTSGVATTQTSNTISCLSTTGFSVGRPVNFTGTVFGGITAGQQYYINSIIDATTFTISTTIGGPIYTLSNAAGYMTITLPNVSVGQPTIETYAFTLKLSSSLGNDLQSYSITVINQNTPISQGGPGLPSNTRIPTIYNTRPSTYNITPDTVDYGYFVLPPGSLVTGATYSPTVNANIGTVNSNTFFAFKVIGHDFDGTGLTYNYANLPLGLVGDRNTGWITGTPVISPDSISQFSFSVQVYKSINPTIFTPFFNFSFVVENAINGDITWVTPNDLGQIYNGSTSILSVLAQSDVALEYRLVSGTLPPNLLLLPSGELSGVVAFQPTDAILTAGNTTQFTFSVEAYSPLFPVVQSTQTFTVEVYQEYQQPTDTLYIACNPSLSDRNLLNTLLTNTTLIPPEYLYRADDPYFGLATSVVYEHAYGINASDFEQYVAAVTQNHYWRNITLGAIKVAQAIDETTGDVIYEVVYSEVVDNLLNLGEQYPNTANIYGASVPQSIYWPTFIPLDLGPWYVSETNIFTSYEISPSGQQFYTSLTPGDARTLYPNSLPNMRNRVGQVLGQVYDSKLLPLWMTSQQVNGSTLGYTPAWVICYTQPGTVTLPEPITLPDGSVTDIVTYAQYIQYQINNNWLNPIGQKQSLNSINFKIDRFTVNKSITYNYDNNSSPPAWTGLPSATPTPDPLDSQDFYVLFPRKTILPDQTQY